LITTLGGDAPTQPFAKVGKVEEVVEGALDWCHVAAGFDAGLNSRVGLMFRTLRSWLVPKVWECQPEGGEDV